MNNIATISADLASKTDVNKLRTACEGAVRLRGRIAAWMGQVITSSKIHELIEEYGSPLNIVHSQLLIDNARELCQTAEVRNVRCRPFFARKANKCLTFIDAATEANIGVDCASATEISQALDRGVKADSIICTAAVKNNALLRICISHGITIVVDNFEELAAIDALLLRHSCSANLAIRFSGFHHQGERLHSRFGFNIEEFADLRRYLCENGSTLRRVIGLHFHLDGYSASERVSAIGQLVPLIDALRKLGEPLTFLDIGGGFPVCYLNHASDWVRFWREHEQALMGKRSEITYRNDPLGRAVHNGEVHGQAKVYPFYQQPIKGAWLASILDDAYCNEKISVAFAKRDFELRCEPGRGLLDNAGVTLARVEGMKDLHGGYAAILLAMNGTQCRTSSADFLSDPLLIRRPESVSQERERGFRGARKEGYLFGAYCTESDLIVKRKLIFPEGIGIGDLIVLPNTAGYFMHFLECRSHQFPLAQNLVYDPGSVEAMRLDEIDLPA